ncbi:MAG: zinc-binding dehydrogenase [Saprospiraceae bacterium]
MNTVLEPEQALSQYLKPLEGQPYRWQMTAVDAPFERVNFDPPVPGPDEALVRVAGCGVCHTDISFWHHGVKMRHELPLTLGHEISGVVEDGPEHLKGKPVIIPAVLPCGECELCRSGRSNICEHQLMPGNDFHGGFASHILVPHRFLCPVPEKALERWSLPQLSVIADAVSTPYQVVEKSGLKAGDFAIVIGVGGVGLYGALLAKIKGATVLAIDIDDAKLEAVRARGIDATLNSRGQDIQTLKKTVRGMAKELGVPAYGWKIFEISGTAAGQELAFNLMGTASTLSIVGFTMDKVNVRLSNLMAFDAQVIGTWGCRAELYPDVVDLVATGKLPVGEFVELFPLSSINEVFRNTLEHRYSKRSVLVPDELYRA